MADYTFIQQERRGPVLIATFNRPPRNLMHAPMVAELSRLVSEVDADEDIRVVILTGAVDGYFIQHYDVRELIQTARAARANPAIGKGDLHATHKAYLQVEESPTPFIAAINGVAHGGGFELALACDFRLVTTDGSVGLPEVGIGILPGAGGTQRLTRLIGIGPATDLILRGRVVGGEEAAKLGMVHRAVPAPRLVAEAMALAEELAALPSRSVALAKSAMKRGIDVPLFPALRIEEDAFWELMRDDEGLRRMENYVKSGGQGPA